MEQTPYQLFIQRLGQLRDWEKAAFRLCTGGDRSRNLEAVRIFYSILPEGIWEKDEETLFMVSCLYCQTRHRGFSGNLGASVKALCDREPQRASGLQNRLKWLMDARSEETLRHYLFDLVRYLDSEGVGINFYRLMVDLLHWDDPKMPSQTAWIKSFRNGESQSVPAGGRP